MSDCCNMRNNLEYLAEQVNSLHEHKNMQIDENRKISRRIDNLESYMEMEDRVTASSVLRRLEELEELNQKCFDANPIGEIEKRFEEMEAFVDDHRSCWLSIHDKLEDMEKEIKELKRFQDIANEKYQDKNRPYKCPVCNAGHNFQVCSACGGKAIVWG